MGRIAEAGLGATSPLTRSSDAATQCQLDRIAAAVEGTPGGLRTAMLQTSAGAGRPPSPTWPFFSMEESTDGDTHRVRLHGELDIAPAAALEARLVEIAGSTVELDLSQLRFIDARGIAALVSARRRIAESGNHLRVVGASGLVRRVLSLVDLDGILDD